MIAAVLVFLGLANCDHLGRSLPSKYGALFQMAFAPMGVVQRVALDCEGTKWDTGDKKLPGLVVAVAYGDYTIEDPSKVVPTRVAFFCAKDVTGTVFTVGRACTASVTLKDGPTITAETVVR